MKHFINLDSLTIIYDSGTLIVYEGYFYSIKMVIVKSKYIVGYISKDDWEKHGSKFGNKRINKVEDGFYCYFRLENDRLYIL